MRTQADQGNPTCGVCGVPANGLQGTMGDDGPICLCTGCWRKRVILPGLGRWYRDEVTAYRRFRKRVPVPPAERQLGGQQAGEVD